MPAIPEPWYIGILFHSTLVIADAAIQAHNTPVVSRLPINAQLEEASNHCVQILVTNNRSVHINHQSNRDARMTIERSLIQASEIVSLITTLLCKCYLLSSLNELTKWRQYPRIPALLIPDAVLILLLGMAMHFALRRSEKRRSKMGMVAVMVWSVLTLMLVSFINSVGGAYYEVSGAIFQWSTGFDFLKDIKTAVEFGGANSGPAVFWMWIHLFIFFGVAALLYSRTRMREYYSLNLKIIEDEDAEMDKDEDDEKTSGYGLWILGASITVYCIWAIMTGPKVGNWNMLCEPQLVSFTKAACGAVWSSNPVVMTARVGEDEYKNCETIRSLFDVYTKAKQTCSKQSAPDFRFTKRTENHQIKNVIWVYLESARNDIMPLNKNSEWVKKNLDQKLIDENPICPFFSSLVNKGIYAEDVRTIGTFTLKSLLGGFCSVVPLPVNRLVEWEKEPYRKCLPRILEQNGWETLYMQPGSSAWDHQRDNLLKIGFKNALGFQEIDEGMIVGERKSRFQSVNYFGRDDIPLVEPMIEWILDNKKKGKSSLAAMLTNVNHDPYYGPVEWPMYSFMKTSEPKINRYLNTVRYTDAFLHKLVKTLDEQHLLEETLLVIMGDHGMALGEHKRVGTNENPEEPMMKVPLLFYSKNKEWLAKNPPRRIRETCSSLDVLPTILDILNEDKKVPEYVFTDYYEGKSLLRDARNKLQITTVNPGGHSIVFHEDGQKVVAKSDTDAVYYNLKRDPNEDEPLAEEELDSDSKTFFSTMMGFRKVLLQKSLVFWDALEGVPLDLE
ncbi:hypothetical protein PSACC_00574 [Paramicrosporidium saccamoebae]|uniref:Sulfatase N-terminal domain-containing protein n=1 Tax=Paramicrosporidium saccamoebae TaxID=1246581 RepID=A0A2H9TPF7_9FUNG|nr:hypothetical protein PSACC_00574 [Paramicrosporidium saccamoebae]